VSLVGHRAADAWKAQARVVVGENAVPGLVLARALGHQQRAKEVDLEHAPARAPDVVQSIATRFEPLRKTVTRNETRTVGSGVASGALNAIDMALPVVTTAQLLAASRRVRQILLRYISPR
jgi:hypothetical protein